MNRIAALLVPWGLAVVTALPAPALEPLPKDLELELAATALPSHLRDDASLYSLDPASGYELVREGTNGFHAFVARTDHGAFLGDWPYVYRDDILVPISFDDAGSKSHMQVYFDVAAARAQGMPAEELKALINERFDSGYYGAPERPGISYMLAPIVRGYQTAEEHDRVVTFSLPHHMTYAPGLTNDAIHGGFSLKQPFVLYQTPHAHGLLIHIAGEKEREQIREENAKLLERLCALKDEFCLPAAG
jgi:hypothetical protein